MAYIGKDPAQVKRALNEKDTFTGDGSTVAFDLTSDASSANEIQVFVDNIRQEPGASDAYTLGEDGSGNLRRITFTAAPDSGAEIYVLNPKTIDSNLIVPSDNSVTSAKIVDGTIVNADINACAAISDTKLGTISTACKVATTAISQPGSSSVYLAGDGSWGAIDTSQQDTNAFNISLLGFKMAVNEGLTVFNLVDGVVDEFNDESGTDEAEGSNDLYCGTSDYYINSTVADGTPVAALSAGFSSTTITEPDTSVAATNPSYGSGTLGTFTVPSGVSSLTLYTWGGGGGMGNNPSDTVYAGGGGGFATGNLAVTGCQSLKVLIAEGGGASNSGTFPSPLTSSPGTIGNAASWGGGGGLVGPGTADGCSGFAAGGGASAIFAPTVSYSVASCGVPAPNAPGIYMVAAGGGGAGWGQNNGSIGGGAGGGLTGDAGATTNEQTAKNGAHPASGGGGDQEQGGQGGTLGQAGDPGTFMAGGGAGETNGGAGGGGYYGGGGAAGSGPASDDRYGGGGSSYYGHPQITCGSTEEGSGDTGGGTTNPNYVACTNEGGAPRGTNGENGYVLISAAAICASATSTTIVSEPFTSTSVPTSARIVVFEENIDTPTLNTDVIASISRDGGTTFTNATLTDSGYVTGSSGQRILTGQATISGQPSGQSMRWKLALANNTVKIHGVSLQWA